MEKATGPLVVLKMVKQVGEWKINIMTDLTNQIILEGFNPAERQLSTIVNCYRGRGDAFKRRKYRGFSKQP